jgi:hypothetical protein
LPNVHKVSANRPHNAIQASMTSRSSMICPARPNHSRWCGLALAAVYVPPDKNSDFESDKLCLEIVGI